MSVYTERLSEALVPVGYLAPIGTGTTEVLTAAIDLSKYRRVIFYVQGGVLGTGATLTFVVKGATSAAGSYTAIASTQVTLVKATDDGLVQVVEITAEQVAALGLGYAFVKGSLTPSAASQYAVLALGAVGRYEPVEGSAASPVKAITVL